MPTFAIRPPNSVYPTRRPVKPKKKIGISQRYEIGSSKPWGIIQKQCARHLRQRRDLQVGCNVLQRAAVLLFDPIEYAGQ